MTNIILICLRIYLRGEGFKEIKEGLFRKNNIDVRIIEHKDKLS